MALPHPTRRASGTTSAGWPSTPVTTQRPRNRPAPAVEIRETALGTDHPDVAADVAALGRANEAETLYQRALAVLEHTEGADYDLAVLHNNLGLAAAERSDAATAEHHYRRALAIKERLLGSGHADVALTLQNLGVLAADTGHPAEARAHLERALTIFQASLHPDHPKVTDCRATLTSLKSLGQLRTALPAHAVITIECH